MILRVLQRQVRDHLFAIAAPLVWYKAMLLIPKEKSGLPVHNLCEFVNSLLFEHDLGVQLFVEPVDVLLQTLESGHALRQGRAAATELVNLLY